MALASGRKTTRERPHFRAARRAIRVAVEGCTAKSLQATSGSLESAPERRGAGTIGRAMITKCGPSVRPIASAAQREYCLGQPARLLPFPVRGVVTSRAPAVSLWGRIGIVRTRSHLDFNREGLPVPEDDHLDLGADLGKADQVD